MFFHYLENIRLTKEMLVYLGRCDPYRLDALQLRGHKVFNFGNKRVEDI